MNINLSDEQMTDLVAKSLMDAITPEKRDEILKASIVKLMTPDNSSYGNKKSVIQSAFDDAVGRTARQIIEADLSQNPEFQAKVKQLWSDVAEAMFNGERYQTVVKEMADAIVKGLSRDRY